MIVFSESQYFLSIIIPALIVLPICIYKVYTRSHVVTNTYMRYTVLGATAVVCALLLAIICTLQLRTTIYQDRIEYGFCSLNNESNIEKIYLQRIDSFSLIKRSTFDWGLKHDDANTVSYTTSGVNAVQLWIADKKIIIGTHQKDAFFAALRTVYEAHRKTIK